MKGGQAKAVGERIVEDGAVFARMLKRARGQGSTDGLRQKRHPDFSQC
jgi:hypothetical protein